jgi:serine/threonine protein kinase
MQQPAALPWLPDVSKFPLHVTAALQHDRRFCLDNIGAADASGGYGAVFRGTYVDDNGIEYRVCAKRDWFLTLIDGLAADGRPPFDDDELRRFYTRVRNDLTAAWRLLGDRRVVNYLAITTTTRMVASGTVVLPEYFIMEEEGETLATWCEQHPACADNRAAFEGYIQCILEGLSALHSAGITHRDVKPDNIVICRDDPSTAKLIDLGLAKPEVSFRDKAVNSMTAATPLYMAPEFMDPQRASQAVDVWAVGVMCAKWLLEEQIGRREAKALLDTLFGSHGGMQAVHNRLRDAITASPTPQSLLERVASEAMLAHADARPSAIHLANTAAIAIPAERKVASFLRWVGLTRHVLQDCSDRAGSDIQDLITAFLLTDTASIADMTNLVDQLTSISRALASTGQRNLMLLRVARNIILSLLEYNAPALEPRTTDTHDADLHRLLGRVYAKMPSTLNYARALVLFDRVVIKAELEMNLTSAAAAMHDKAKTLSKMGATANLQAAVALCDRVIEIRTTALGADHTETAATMHQKAMALTAMGGSANLQVAVTLFDRIIEIRTTALGADHIETAVTMHEKAGALAKMGGSTNIQAAMTLYDRVIEIMTAALGAHHAYTTTTMHNKAHALVTVGGTANLEAAIALFDRVIESDTIVLGADHIDTAATMHQKAKALVDMGGSANIQAAMTLFDRVIEIRTTALGADHINTAATMQEQAKALINLGGTANLEAAVTLCDRVIEINTTALGPDHTSTAETMHQKAIALTAMGGSTNLQAAVALFDRVIEINTAALGVDHIDTAATMYEKARALVKMGGSANLQAAAALYDRCICVRNAVLGAEHDATVQAKQDKAEVLLQIAIVVA